MGSDRGVEELSLQDRSVDEPISGQKFRSEDALDWLRRYRKLESAEVVRIEVAGLTAYKADD